MDAFSISYPLNFLPSYPMREQESKRSQTNSKNSNLGVANERL